MRSKNWLKILGWNEEQIEDLRFVGYSYIQQGLYDIALTFFQGLVVLQPNNFYDLQTLGGLYLQKKNPLEALHYLDRALKIEPSDFQTLLNRAKALLTLGYKKQGIAQANELQKCNQPEIVKQAKALLLAYNAYTK